MALSLSTELDWSLLLTAKRGKRRESGVSICCPFHDDHSPSAVIFTNGKFFCSVCHISGYPPRNIAEEILGGEISHDLTPHTIYPSLTIIQEQTILFWDAFHHQSAYSSQIKRLSQAKHLNPNTLRDMAIPTAKGLMFPAFVWPLGDGGWDTMEEPFLRNESPYPIYIAGMQYRIKDVLPQRGEKSPKTLTFGFRGLGLPGRKHRPAWAWGGAVPTTTRDILIVEAPQHVAKISETQPQILTMCSFGSNISPWQLNAIKSLKPDTWGYIFDPDCVRLPTNPTIIAEMISRSLYVDLDEHDSAWWSHHLPLFLSRSAKIDAQSDTPLARFPLIPPAPIKP